MSEGVRPGGTYKTLAEQREVLTPAEERFEVVRQTIGLILGPIAFLIMYFLPLPLDRSQHTLAAILTFTIIYWLSEAIPIPVTAVLALALCVIFNVPDVGPNADDAPGDVVFGAFMDPVIFLFIGAFIIAQAMITHGLDRRFAFLVLRAHRHHHLGDDVEHRFGHHSRAHRHPDSQRGGARPASARARGRLRRFLRVHDASVHAAERRRLRLGHDPDHQDGPLRARVRHHRFDPYSAPHPSDGGPDPGVSLPPSGKKRVCLPV
jgi:hypothetical protein